MPRRATALKLTKVSWFLLLSAAATITAIAVSLGTAYSYLGDGVSYDLQPKNSTARTVELTAHFISVDAKQGTMVVDWHPIATENCTREPTVYDFFFDRNILVSSEKEEEEAPSNNVEQKPIFQLNNTCTDPVRLTRGDARLNAAKFRTTTMLFGNMNAKKRRVPTSLQAYPFDTYFADIFVFATLNETGEWVSIDHPPPEGHPLNFHVTLDYEESFSGPEGLNIVVNISRSQPVKVLAVIIVLANWFVTVAFIFVTIAAFIWPEDVVKEVFVIPIATLFAFTAVRSNLPGAPEGFGAFLDYVGILPNLAILTLCGAALLGVILTKRIQSSKPPPPRKDEFLETPLVDKEEFSVRVMR